LIELTQRHGFCRGAAFNFRRKSKGAT